MSTPRHGAAAVAGRSQRPQLRLIYKCQSLEEPARHLSSTWQDLSDKKEGLSFEYSQSQWETLAVAMRGLRRIPLAQRSDADLLARHVTYSAGAELCYGKRGDGSYTSERPSGGCTCSKSGERKCHGPHHWTDVANPLHIHAHVNGQTPVQ